MKKRISVALLLLCLAEPLLADEVTLARHILEFNVDASSNTHYFKAADSAASSSAVTWGPASCPNAQFVYTRELAGQKDVLAIAWSASAIGRAVTFRGTCDPDGNYFRATRIIMSQ